MLLDALAQRLALRDGGAAPGQIEQRQVHAMGDHVAERARAVGRHRGQFAPGAAHRLQRHAGHAALAAERPRHQIVDHEAALGELRLRQHDDQVLHPRGVRDRVGVGGVVDAPLTRHHPGLAPLLLDAGAAEERRHDLQVTHFAGAHLAGRTHHPVAVGLQPRQDDVARVQAVHAAVEARVAVEVGAQALEQAVDPVGPVRNAVAQRHVIGIHRLRHLGHRASPVLAAHYRNAASPGRDPDTGVGPRETPHRPARLGKPGCMAGTDAAPCAA